LALSPNRVGQQKLTGWPASYRQAQRSGQGDVEFAQLTGT
jgi:hypothetical protein